MYIISVPVVFSVKTPTSGWINLALVRQIQHEEFPANTVVITWLDGDKQVFNGLDAQAIIDAWKNAHMKLEQSVKGNKNER